MLWFPRTLQGAGRHDNPDLYGCLYCAEDPMSAVAEALAPFRASGALDASMFRRAGRPLHLGKLEFPDESIVLDLDDPHILARESLRPSSVATRHRSTTQRQAERLYRAYPEAAALRWWSTLESTLINLTLFDRARDALTLAESRELTIESAEVQAAAEMLGLA